MLRRWSISYAVLLSVTGLLGSTPIYADTIAVIGTGDVAGALGPEFAAQGHTIVYGSRNPSRDDVRALVARTGNAASATTPVPMPATRAQAATPLQLSATSCDSITFDSPKFPCEADYKTGTSYYHQFLRLTIKELFDDQSKRFLPA